MIVYFRARVSARHRTRASHLVWLAVSLWCSNASCSSGDGPTDPVDAQLASEFRLDADGELAESVVVDSVRWEPLVFGFTTSDELELEGTYAIHFRNATERSLELRYDLRFLDRDGFLFDIFIPFGLPVSLGPAEGKLESGHFLIRSRDSEPGVVKTMQIVATVTPAP